MDANTFWAKLDRSGECWTWAMARGNSGYGMVSLNGRTLGAHRVAWELSHGPVPNGLHVLHHCDNKPCARPSHLFLGTPADNRADAVAKGRVPVPGTGSTGEGVVKRRVIWLTDDEWIHLKARAVREGVNISNMVRALAGEPKAVVDRFGSPRPAPKPGK